MATAIWHGTETEIKAVLAAIGRTCVNCAVRLKAPNGRLCSDHAPVLDDAEFVNRLLCERKRRGELLKQEFKGC